MSHNRSNSVALAAVAALALWGCGGGDNIGPQKPVIAVTVTPTTSTIAPGRTVQLQAATKDADGATVTGRAIAWSSSDNAVATVSAAGLVTGVADGSATITASVEGQSGAAVITVATRQLELAAVSVGSGHTCGLTNNGAAYCWGDNTEGQLGDGSLFAASRPVPVSGGLGFSALAPGGVHTCGLTSTGAPYCWGGNDYGQLGTGLTTSSSTPVAVSGGLSFSALATGVQHTCGLTTAGAAYCWGRNEEGQLGNGSFTNSPIPVAVSRGFTFSALATGGYHTCGLTTAGAAYCWGWNVYGQLGNGREGFMSTPIPVAVWGDLSFSALAGSGGFGHSCALTGAGAAYCWGANIAGELGNGSRDFKTSSTPLAVSGGLSFSAVVTGFQHTCGLTSGGTAYCWGDDHWGELGDSSATCETCESPTPVPVYGDLSFRTLTSSGGHTCGLTNNGPAYCWGLNDFGQLGDGSTTNRSAPVLVGEPKAATHMAAAMRCDIARGNEFRISTNCAERSSTLKPE